MSSTLSGLCVLVTRTANQAGDFSQQLRDRGAEVVEVPLLKIAPPDDWEPFDQALQNIHEYSWIALASSNAVDSFFRRAAELRKLPLPSSVQIAVMGPATARTVEMYGHRAQYHPDKFIAESFVQQFPGYPHLYAVKILWPRSDAGRDYIKNELTKAGAFVDAVACYRSTMPDNKDGVSTQLAALFRDRRVNAITVASPQTARNLVALSKSILSEEEQLRLVLPVPIVTIGPETSAAARACKFFHVQQAEPFNVEGMIVALERLRTAGTPTENH